MMKQMGMKMDELKGFNTVIFKSPSKEILIEGAMITSINLQGQKMYQITGGKETTRKTEDDSKITEQPPLEIPEEDVLLVAQQAKVSMEKARATLEQVEGDLARAILMLQTG
jgi:nascent polypeptide-associated complex subunit alpha